MAERRSLVGVRALAFASFFAAAACGSSDAREGGVCARDAAAALARGEVRMYLAGSWYRIPLEPNADDPVSRLDVQVLAERILSPMLGIENQRTDERISFVGGIRGTKALSDAVDAGEAMLAFSLPAVTPAELLAVADASRTMPPKSTWFEPKLRSGLLVYTL